MGILKLNFDKKRKFRITTIFDELLFSGETNSIVLDFESGVKKMKVDEVWEGIIPSSGNLFYKNGEIYFEKMKIPNLLSNKKINWNWIIVIFVLVIFVFILTKNYI